MRLKFYAIFLLVANFLIFTPKIKAQSTSCNAAFTFTVNGFNVNFTPAIVGDTIHVFHYWHFGDGTVSTIPVPSHTYANCATYSVMHYMRYTNSNGTIVCTDSVVHPVVIQQCPTACNIQANFYSYPDSTSSGINWNIIHFFNSSLNYLSTDTIRWNFGDGSAYYFGNNPTHTYATAGTYNVCLRIARFRPAGAATCVSEICHTTIVVPTTTCNIQANFYSYPDSSSSGLNWNIIHFMNSSINYQPNDTIRWNFGDGTVYYYGNNPTHTYANAGTYNVCLRIARARPNGASTTCVSEICHTINVVPPTATCNLHASYNFYRDSSNRNKVNFYNTSTVVQTNDSVRWTFGDGSLPVYTFNSTHIFPGPGTYTVCLRMKRNTPTNPSSCVSEYCHTVIIDSGICPTTINFSNYLDTINHLKVHFTNLSTFTPGATVIWTFGDGTTSTNWNTDHIYAHAGNYSVCLRIQYSNACVKYYCKVVVIPTPNVPCVLLPYPNPATSIVNISVTLMVPQPINMRVYNAQGIIVRQLQQTGVIGTNILSVNVYNLPAGLYRIVINHGNDECHGYFIKN